MSNLLNFKEAKDCYLKYQPKEIDVFANWHQGNDLMDNNTLYYRFIFSEQKNRRFENLSEKFKNTNDLYKKIVKEFFDNSLLTSVGFKQKHLKQIYNGICLENANEEKLNIYFSDYVMAASDEVVAWLIERQQQDFFSYAKKYIENDEVNRFVIRSSACDKSNVIYLDYDDIKYSSLQSGNQLGYYFQKSDCKINEVDKRIILKLIYQFINYNLDENPFYKYQMNTKVETTALNIFFESGMRIEINDSDLIYWLEKAGLINNLWKIMHEKIEKMPDSEEDYKRLLNRKIPNRVINK